MHNWQHDSAYREIVDELLEEPAVQQLSDYVQHHHTDRLTHSISVSYRSYRIAKLLHLNATAVARAGILHDLFYYDWRDTKFESGNHAYIHPRIALRNAERLTPLTHMERDIIIKHMWGVTPEIPKYRESFLVDIVDDYVAVTEFFIPTKQRVRKLFHSYNR